MLNTQKIASVSSRLVRVMSHISSADTASGATPWKEIRIPVPWGHIAAKEWGTAGKQAVLGIHGWQDNCGSFDTLAPLLRLSDIHMVTIDLPGHGLSSHKPPGTLYHICDWIIDIRRVIKFLGWKEYSIIGHSMGANIAVVYSSVYPTEVQKLVALENVKPAIYNLDNLTERIGKGVEELFYYEERVTRPQPKVTIEDAVQMIKDAMFESCTTQAAEILLIRGATQLDGGQIVFNRDPRLKCHSIPGLSAEQMKQFAINLKCEYMLIQATDGVIYRLQQRTEVEETLDRFKKSAKSFEVVDVEGTHHVHLNNPERVAPHINRFLSADSELAIP
ncbi:Serine hydrolase-like protein 2 [Chamberlinius hualienensis]